MVGNSGRYSKFQQRLKNIYLSWLKKRKKKKINQDKFVEEKVKEIRRVMGNSNVVTVRKVGIIDKKMVISKKEKKFENKTLIKNNIDNKILVDDKDNNIVSVSYILNEKKHSNKGNVNNVFIEKGKNKISTNRAKLSDDDKLNLTKVEIINKLKNKFVEKLAELEVIESELYFISETIDNSLDAKEVKELRKK